MTPLDAVQLDLLEQNITDKRVEYKDPNRGFWRIGRGVGLERKKGKPVVALVQPAAKRRVLRLPLDNVRLLDAIQDKAPV